MVIGMDTGDIRILKHKTVDLTLKSDSPQNTLKSQRIFEKVFPRKQERVPSVETT